jgi:hypothetical protein
MKHDALISSEFCKTALDFSSEKEMHEYLKRHPKANRQKHRIVAPKRQLTSDEGLQIAPQQKAVYAMLEMQQEAAKKYLIGVLNYLKEPSDLTKGRALDVKFSPNLSIDELNTDNVEFNDPVTIDGERFKIGMRLNYPKIRCTHIQTDANLDSQTPQSLKYKIYQGLHKSVTDNPFSSKAF